MWRAWICRAASHGASAARRRADAAARIAAERAERDELMAHRLGPLLRRQRLEMAGEELIREADR